MEVEVRLWKSMGEKNIDSFDSCPQQTVCCLLVVKRYDKEWSGFVIAYLVIDKSILYEHDSFSFLLAEMHSGFNTQRWQQKKLPTGTSLTKM